VASLKQHNTWVLFILKLQSGMDITIEYTSDPKLCWALTLLKRENKVLVTHRKTIAEIGESKRLSMNY